MNTLTEALTAVGRAWATFVPECLSVLGSELHYQAMFYHHLRTSGGVPLCQVGMNVKMWIENPVSPLFQALSKRKHADYQGGFEPIPDIVIFKPEIASDWRRRNYANTLRQMLVALEIKASERANSRLSPKEIREDIEKLAAHRSEVQQRGGEIFPIMTVLDTAPDTKERMTPSALASALELTIQQGIGLLYCSPECSHNTLAVIAECKNTMKNT